MKKSAFLLLFMAAITVCSAQNVSNILLPNKNFYHEAGEEYVLLSPTGKVIKSFKGLQVFGQILSDGMIAAEDLKTKKMGYLSAVTGEWAITPQFETAEAFSEGFAVVKRTKNDTTESAVINKMGKIIFPYSKLTIDKFREGMAFAYDESLKYGAIDQTGKMAIPLSWGDLSFFSNGLSVKGNDGKWGYIDKTNKVVIPATWDTADDFSEGLAGVGSRFGIVNSEAKWGYMDIKGKLVIPHEYAAITPFSEGIAMVKVTVGKGDDAAEKPLFIDQTGKRLNKEIYESAMPFKGGFAAVVKLGDEDLKWGFINKSGKLAIPMVHEMAGGYEPEMSFSEGLCPTKKGYIDTTGKLVISFPKSGELAEATLFKNGVATFALFNGQGEGFKYTMVDKTGKILWQSVDNQSLCFPAGVYVSLANGSRKKIEDIKIGDAVLDLNNTPSVVKGLDVHQGSFNIGALHFNMPETVDFVSNDALQNTVLLEATLNHPLPIFSGQVSISGKKVPLNDVKIGDSVLQVIDNQVVETSVNHFNKKYRTVKVVYNLRTSGKGFFVNGYGVFNK
jgi:WG containing repeat